MAIAAKNFAHERDELERSFIVDLVVNPVGLFFAPEDPFFSENGQMLGNIALGRAASIYDFLNAGAAVTEDAKDLKPQGVGHRLDTQRGLRDVLFAVNEIILHSVITLFAVVAGCSIPDRRGI